MSSGLYVERETFFHKLDPRAKLVWLLLVLVASIATQFNGLKGIPIFASLVVALSLSGLGAGLAALLVVNASAFLAAVTLVWASLYSNQGNLLFSLGFLKITDYGLLVALGKFFLIICPVLAFVIFFSSTKPYHLTWALERLGVPSKIALTFTLALNLLPSAVRAVKEVIDAQKARGLALDRGGPLQRLKNHLPIIVPVISKLLSDVWDLSMVLASRFVGLAKRTYVFEPRWRLRDTLFVLASTLLYGGVVAWGLQPSL